MNFTIKMLIKRYIEYCTYTTPKCSVIIIIFLLLCYKLSNIITNNIFNGDIQQIGSFPPIQERFTLTLPHLGMGVIPTGPSNTPLFYTPRQISTFKFITCVRTYNNVKHIDEFLNYYYHIGMTKLYLILDTSDPISANNTAKIAAPYVKLGFVHLIRGGNGFKNTFKSLEKCYNNLKDMKQTWYLAVDDDEYLTPAHNEMTIQSAFLRMPSNITCFRPPRYNFGMKVNLSVFPQTVINMHRWRGKTPNWLPKSIFLIEATNGTQYGSIDHGQRREKCNELGPTMNAIRPPNEKDPAPLYMYHYFTQTNALRSPILNRNYNNIKNQNEVYDNSMQRFVVLLNKTSSI